MPYAIKEVARPVSLVVGTPALTITDLGEWSYTDEKTIDFRSSGNTTYDRHTLSKFGKVLSVKTTDVNLALASLEKGATVANVVFLAEAPYVGDAGGTTNSIGLQHTSRLQVSMSYAIVEECGPISGNEDGSPAEYEIKFRAIRKPDGTAPVVTVTLVTT